MIGRIDHIGVAVASIAEARRLYEALGLTVEAIEEVPAEGVRVAMIRCGTSAIELLEPTDPDSPVARFLASRGPGIHHLCLASDDLPGDDRRLREAGFTLLRDRPTRGAGGCWVQFVHPKSAGGVLLELSQPAAEREQEGVEAAAGGEGGGEGAAGGRGGGGSQVGVEGSGSPDGGQGGGSTAGCEGGRP